MTIRKLKVTNRQKHRHGFEFCMHRDANTKEPKKIASSSTSATSWAPILKKLTDLSQFASSDSEMKKSQTNDQEKRKVINKISKQFLTIEDNFGHQYLLTVWLFKPNNQVKN